MAKKTKPLSIVLLSGGTGRTCEEVVTAALAQFEEPDARVFPRPNVRSAEAARKVVREAKKENAIICHTLIAPKVREAVLQEAKKELVPTVDVLGPVVNILDDHLATSPKREAGLSYAQHKAQFDRIDAVNFTLAHDDGLRAKDLPQADVVLVGLSRVSKSVTCFYLAYRGVRAANVPLIRDCPLLPQLLEVDAKKVIALMMNAQRLQKIRESRAEYMGKGVPSEYSDPRGVKEEVRFVTDLVARHRWRTIDVSYRSTEEVAKEVIRMIGG